MTEVEPCPECGTTRRNAQDVANQYCPRCHWWTLDPSMADVWRREWPEKAAEAHAFRAAMAAKAAKLGEGRAGER